MEQCRRRSPRGSSLNRNILECKLTQSLALYLSVSVLIETYWNVNVSGTRRHFYNVRLNRNILECKYTVQQRQHNG